MAIIIDLGNYPTFSLRFARIRQMAMRDKLGRAIIASSVSLKCYYMGRNMGDNGESLYPL